MSRKRMFASTISAGLAVAGLAVTGAGSSAGAAVRTAAVQPAITTMAGSVAPFTGSTPAIGNVAASQRLTIQLWLQPRTAAATLFAQAVSTPGSSQFHHYLSPDAYAARFAATQADAGTVESWLRARGFTAVSTDPQRSYVRATATAATINRAFDVRLKLYKSAAGVNAGTNALWSNNRPVSLPATLARVVLGVTGLDDAAPVDQVAQLPGTTARTETESSAAASAACSVYYGQHLQGGRPAHFLPDPGLRLLRQAAARCLRGHHDQHRQGRDHRLHGVGPGSDYAADVAGLRQGQRPAGPF
jgi:hypothetical protein